MASETPRIALAPRFFLFGVPSSSIIRWSMRDLVERVHADQLVGDASSLTLATALRHALAQIDALVAVAQLPGFVDAGAGAAGHGGAAERAVVQRDVDFDGRIAAAIENLAAVDINDRAHGRVQSSGFRVQKEERVVTFWRDSVQWLTRVGARFSMRHAADTI